MTLEQLKTIQEQFITALKEYQTAQGYDEIELEKVLDDTLCRLPRDIIYVEWYDRSQVEYLADNWIKYLNEVNQPTKKTAVLIDDCMYDLWNANDSFMTDDGIQSIVCDRINYKGE